MVKTKAEVWPTTVDNPFDPFSQWDQWYRFDERSGYHTCSTLARLARPSNDLTDAEYDDCVNHAIATLINWYEPNEVYRLAVEGQEQTFGRSRS